MRRKIVTAKGYKRPKRSSKASSSSSSITLLPPRKNMAFTFGHCRHPDDIDYLPDRIFHADPHHDRPYETDNPHNFYGPVYALPHAHNQSRRQNHLFGSDRRAHTTASPSPRSRSLNIDTPIQNENEHYANETRPEPAHARQPNPSQDGIPSLTEQAANLSFQTRDRRRQHPIDDEDIHPSFNIKTLIQYQPLEFDAAARLLDKTVQDAIEFFRAFQDDFADDVARISYARPATMNQAWKDKVAMNEAGLYTPDQGRKAPKSNTDSHNRGDELSNTYHNEGVYNRNTENELANENQNNSTEPPISPQIFHHLLSKVSRQIHNLSKSRVPNLSPKSTHKISNQTLNQAQRNEASTTLKRKLHRTASEFLDLSKSMRTDYWSMKPAITELESMRDLLRRYWDTWSESAQKQE